MKFITKSKLLTIVLFSTVNAPSLFAQTKTDIFDISQTKFIGQPEKVTNDKFRDSFTVQWNELTL